MASDMETIEKRLKSFTGQLQTEFGILKRLVYKHKNQHRRCSYFQYVLKVRRDLNLLKSANVEYVFDSSFLVINGNQPKQKIQLLESLKRRKCGARKFNFLERLLGITRLLSQMVEPLLKAAMGISTLLAQSFFMKFSLTTLAVLARIRVLVQQMLLDAVLLYNTVFSISQKEQSVKLNQKGFEVFQEYYPIKDEASIMLECVWQTDKYMLVEHRQNSDSDSQEKGVTGDIPCALEIQYENLEVLLGDDSAAASSVAKPSPSSPININKDNDLSAMKTHERVIEGYSSDTAGPSSTETLASSGHVLPTNDSLAGMVFESNDSKSGECDLATSSSKPLVANCVKLNDKKRERVAFVSVKPPTPSTALNESKPMDSTSLEKEGDENDDDLFFERLTGGSKKRHIL